MEVISGIFSFFNKVRYVLRITADPTVELLYATSILFRGIIRRRI